MKLLDNKIFLFSDRTTFFKILKPKIPPNIE